MPAIQNKKTDRTKVKIVSGTTSDFECTLCVFVAQTVEGLIKQNKTEDEIKDLVEKICNYFPGTLKDQVNWFLNIIILGSLLIIWFFLILVSFICWRIHCLCCWVIGRWFRSKSSMPKIKIMSSFVDESRF